MLRHKRRIVLAVALSSLGLGIVRSLAQEPPLAGPKRAPTFVLRVNPRWADRVNAVLKRVANPSEFTVPPGMTPAALVQSLCGGHAVDSPTPVADEPGKIRIAPCVHIATRVKVTVRPGNTLEEIAIHNGLPTAAGMKVTRPNTMQPVSPTALRAGDVVSIPEVPLWTIVAVRDELIKDRKSIVDAIGAELKCAGNQDDCLLKRGIFVLEGSGATPVPQLPPPLRDPNEQMLGVKPDVPKEILDLGGIEERTAFVMSSLPPTLTALPKSIPVAADQWPYDVRLLAAIYANLHDPFPYGGNVGVADLGLADGNGGPLPNDLFDHSQDQRPDYAQDVIGAGVKRSANDIVATGDVSLCAGDVRPPFSEWAPNPFNIASHASVTVSVSGALPVRHNYPDWSQRLPHIVFFRLLPNLCDPTASYDPGEGALAPAFTYLAQRSDVVAIPFMSYSSPLTNFVNMIRLYLSQGDQILVLPSGDNSPGNLDKNPFSPQLLGSDTQGPQVANRTVVVGAATRDLVIADYSNFGDHTVSLYAPGEPAGAVNIAGRDASASKPATSYAAPYVALAAGILRSFGYTHAIDIRDRLAAATWPLAGVEDSRIGVVDLVKVAAVQQHAIEVLEPGPDGVLVRRTYVGNLRERLQDLTLCTGHAFLESNVITVRIDGEGPDRTARAYSRNEHDPNGGPLGGRRKIQDVPACRSQGVLHINALLAGPKTIPLASVTQIQLPWAPVR